MHNLFVTSRLDPVKVVVRHHPVLVLLHWILAVMLIAALAQGSLILQRVTNASPEKLDLLRLHMVVGISILGLTLIRLAVAAFTRHPPAPSQSLSLTRLSRATHALLYVLVLSMAASGIGIAAAAHLPNILFGHVGTLPSTFDGLPPRALHAIFAKLLMALVTAHILAVAYHQLIRKDGLLRRMSLRSKPGLPS